MPYKKFAHKIIISIFCFFISVSSFCQGSVWNSNSFQLSRDNAQLEDITTATLLPINNGPIYSSASVSFGGFAFRYGLSSYSNFYVSPYGFIKLGSPISSNNPLLDSSVIVALNNGTYWTALYKSVGSYPNRKMVIHFAGVMQPSGEPTNFQIWLYERTGKIQFVYQQIRGFYGFGSSWSYKIFCSTPIMNKTTVAGIKVNPNNAAPSVNYSTIPLSFDSIYANTRFTFQPDTVKPAIPSSLSFSNIQAGCLSVDITENSSNESQVTLERADDGVSFTKEKVYYVSSPAGSTTYNYAQTFIQPFWNYTYRTYVSNGFLNSDTLVNTVQTLMPQINGVKKIPGDYPTIKALLQDAPCKHLGPNLVIELQSNYSFASETIPVSFGSILQNRLIQSIVIRPALNATINWDAFTNTALFYVDSVKHVFLDGRPGGTGTNQNFTISQQNPQVAVIQYTNKADSGGINYCRIIKKSGSSSSYAIVVVPKDSTYSYNKKTIDAFSLTNNFIAADNNGLVSDLVYINPSDSVGCRDFFIAGNQFSRFRRSAIHFENGGENLQISNNRFFQPVSFQPIIFLPYTYASCISVLNTGKVTIDNNFFGGSSSVWGTGKFSINASSTNFSFINYQNNTFGKKVFITNNKFGNIEFLGYSYSGSKLIYTSKGDVLIDNNQFGTSDSSNSITSAEFFWGVDLVYGNHTFSNNYFSGFQGGYLTGGTVNSSYFLTTSFTDSVAFLNNDIGGIDDPLSNSSSGVIHGIYLGGVEKSVAIRNNIVRGISSRNRSVTGISGSNATSSVSLLKMEVDSNAIHHLQASSSATGIALRPNSRGINRISYNTIYALKTTGKTLDPNGGGYLGTLYGITYTMYNWGYSPLDYKGEVQIFGNRIHSFESLRTLSNSIFSNYGITVTSPISKTYNNEIRLGIDSKGQPVDSLTSLNGIAIAPVDYQLFLSDKHFVEHNSIYFGGKGPVGSALYIYYSYNYISPGNSIIITNNILNLDRIPLSGSSVTPDIYESISSIKSLGAKNIWYSTAIPNTPALLQTFKNTCHCDSSSFVGNPAFINPAGDSSNYNLHLGAGSLADSTGTPSVLGISKDLDNKNRNAFSPVDIGCYAATPCGTGIFPEITLSPADDSLQLCTGSTLTLTASITGGTFQQLQWQVNLVDSIGQNSLSLVVNHTGAYRIVGKTSCGQVASKMVYVVNYPLQQSVTIKATPADSICQGAVATFTAAAVHCGNNPVYQWKVNGVNAGINSPIFTSGSLNNNDSVKVIVTTNVCGSGQTVTSNTIGIKVIPYTTPSITILANTITICAGNPVPVTFTATITNGGPNPVYQWQLNGANVGTNSNSFSPTVINNNDQIKCILTSNGTCTSPAVVISNVITMSVVNGTIVPTVTISTANTNTCTGSNVTFTATAINGGTSPSYQWKVNGITVGTNSSTFSINTLTNGSIVNVVLTSSLPCASPTSATSNTIIISVSTPVIPSVSISTSSMIICPGTNVIFTATPINGGASPAYQWKKNGINVGTNTATYSSNTLVNGDIISVTLTSNAPCASPTNLSSNNISISVYPITAPGININGATTVVQGSSVPITSTITNGGSSPAYQWQDSAATHSWLSIVGAITSAINYVPILTGDKIRCILTSSNTCITNNTVASNVLQFTVTPQFGIIRYYPNPVSSYLIIDGLSRRNSWETVHIITMVGAKIITLPDITGLTRVVVNVQALPPGIYICILNSRFGYTDYYKFVKQ